MRYNRFKMIVLGGGSDNKFHSLYPLIPEFIFGNHPSYDSGKQFSGILFHDDIPSHLLEIPFVSAVGIHDIVLQFVSRDFDLVDILYKHEISGIPEIGVICLMLS